LEDLGNTIRGTQSDLQCKNPPTPGDPKDGLAGWIDAGPSTPGNGLYSRYGYGGYEPVIYDPGCPLSIHNGAQGAISRIFDPRNEAATLYIQLQLVAVAVAVEATHIVFTPEGIWSFITPITTFTRHTLGARWWLLFGTLSLAATGIYWLLRSRRGDLAEASSASAKSALILTTGALTLATTVTAGSLISTGVAAFYTAMGEATTQATHTSGPVNPAQPPPTDLPALGKTDAVIGDMLMQNVIYPSWATIHFGPDQKAAAQFGPRLFAAGTYTRHEAQRATIDRAYAAHIQAAKKADYARVAAEYHTTYPGTYDRYFAGNDTSERPSAALAGLLACLPIVVFLTWSLWWMGTLRLVLDIALAIAPIGALIAQFPRLQWTASAMVRWISSYFLTAAIATTLFVVFVAGGVGNILGAEASTSAKVLAMLIMLVVARSAWKRRHLLAQHTGVNKDTRTLATALEALREEFRQLRDNSVKNTPTEAVIPSAVFVRAETSHIDDRELPDETPRRITVHGETAQPTEQRTALTPQHPTAYYENEQTQTLISAQTPNNFDELAQHQLGQANNVHVHGDQIDRPRRLDASSCSSNIAASKVHKDNNLTCQENQKERSQRACTSDA
ncbi:hypothetical protein, partial [Dermatophilus congolensis]